MLFLINVQKKPRMVHEAESSFDFLFIINLSQTQDKYCTPKLIITQDKYCTPKLLITQHEENNKELFINLYASFSGKVIGSPTCIFAGLMKLAPVTSLA